jgi:hypothetical protein
MKPAATPARRFARQLRHGTGTAWPCWLLSNLLLLATGGLSGLWLLRQRLA